MEHVHVIADHGAWMLYLAGAAYWILPSIHWFLGQPGPGPELHCATTLVGCKAGWFRSTAVLAGLRAVVAAAGGVQRRSI